MARILVITGPVVSTTTAAWELGRRLVRAGHEVVLAQPEGVAVRGVPPLPRVEVPAVGVARFRYPDLAGDPQVAAAGWRPRDRRRAAIGRLGFDRIRDRVAALAPDLVLVDIELPEHTLAALALGVPVAGLSSFIDPWRRRGVPPLHSPTVPRGGVASDLAIAREWTVLLAGRAVSILRSRVGQRATDRLGVMRAYARREGLGRRVDASHWLIPGIVNDLPVLVMSASELDLPHRPRRVERVVGPMLREDAEVQVALEPALAAVVDRTRSAGRRLVYCSFGTAARSYDWSLVDRVIGAVARHPEWQLVLALGGVTGGEPTGPLPANVEVFDHVPQLEVLELSDLAVIHAGANTIHECLITGTPMVSFPMDHTDQGGNGARIVFHGVGRVGDRTADDTDAVERLLVAALADRAMADRVRALGEQLAAYRRRGVLDAVVGELLARAGR